jgi:hypothetical protein
MDNVGTSAENLGIFDRFDHRRRVSLSTSVAQPEFIGVARASSQTQHAPQQ